MILFKYFKEETEYHKITTLLSQHYLLMTGFIFPGFNLRTVSASEEN